jgi:hypothetical protein
MFASVSLFGGKMIVVNLSEQEAYAYEDGRMVMHGHVSTGKPGRRTPTGRFRVLEKDIDHVSSKYPRPNGGAKMNYMLRLTDYGVAMHLGYVPNYPASHGCIRMENGFAQKMYYWANVGTRVLIKGTPPRYVNRSGSSGFSGSGRGYVFDDLDSDGYGHRRSVSAKRRAKSVASRSVNRSLYVLNDMALQRSPYRESGASSKKRIESEGGDRVRRRYRHTRRHYRNRKISMSDKKAYSGNMPLMMLSSVPGKREWVEREYEKRRVQKAKKLTVEEQIKPLDMLRG